MIPPRCPDGGTRLMAWLILTLFAAMLACMLWAFFS